MLGNCYIISDLHLSEERPTMVSLFSCFLQEITLLAHTLYILGDFFDYWIGDDDLTDFHRSVISLLDHAVKNGLKIYLMHGNRDFLIGQQFAKQSGVTLIPDPLVLNNGQQQILLMHGDLLCTDDKSYQLFRKVVRNPVIKFLYLSLPLSLRREIAKMIRQKSQQKNKHVKIIDVTTKGINRYIKDYKVLIHGHTHLFNCHRAKHYTRYVLGDWHSSGSFIKIHDNKISLEKYEVSRFKL